jgi:penicillin-binding protein 2
LVEGGIKLNFWNFFSERQNIFYLVSSLIVIVLAARFFSLQIISGELYQQQSLENSVKIETKFPVRGNIYDRNGKLIADNRPAFSVYLVRSRTNSQTIKFVSSILNIDKDEIQEKLKQGGPFQPVKIARHVNQVTLTTLQENILDLPGLEWKVEPKRHYVYSRAFSHVLGTLGEIDEDELDKNSEYEPGDVVGKKGVEKKLDQQLRGKKGYEFVKVDALGRVVEKVNQKKSSLPYPGKDLYLTIDSRLQKCADSLFAGYRGALVAIDVRNGEILTMLSNPNYDLNIFAGPVNSKIWNDLISDSLNPLYDRATQSTYPPGSTYKLVAAIAALNEHIITPHWSVNCPGYYKIGRRVVHCWKATGHGTLDLTGAIRNSCNVYFYRLGLEIGLDVWTKYSKLFGFGSQTKVELANEKEGLVPSKDYYERVYGIRNITAGLVANLAIGQGELLVTPIQMAQFAMILANEGVYYRPHLIHKLLDKVTKTEESPQISEKKIDSIEPEVFEIIKKAMGEVVAEGTGVRARIIGVKVAGKTGTAQNPHGDSHSWFICFAPYDNPEIAVSVIAENAGGGSAVAAPIAGNYLRRYFYLKGMFDYEKERKILQEIWRKKKQQEEDQLKIQLPL